MSKIASIAPAERRLLKKLFESHRHLRVGIDGVLEGRFGEAWAHRDALETPPEPPCAARLNLGPFVFLAGDPASDEAADLVNTLSGVCIFIFPTESWRTRARSLIPPTVEIHPQARIAFSADALDPDHLRELARPADANTDILPMDSELITRSLEEVSNDLLFEPAFATPEALAREGLGYCAAKSDAGGESAPSQLVSAATSGMLSSTAIEIQVNTHESHRRQGHARAVSAALMLEALALGKTPHWDSASPASQQLARQLGYRDRGEYQWWFANLGSQ